MDTDSDRALAYENIPPELNKLFQFEKLLLFVSEYKKSEVTYISNFIGQGVCFITILHIHLEFRVCFTVLVQFNYIIMIANHLMNTAFLSCILPVVLA